MRPTVYIETSVVSYLTARPSRDLVVAALQQMTREWWEGQLHKLDARISPAVLDEISRGDPAMAARRLEAVKGMVALEINEAVRDLADGYFAAMQLPESARPDATHLAVACWHGVEYLVTWNCGHIANARVEKLVRAINDRRGIETPVICTPQELQEP